MYIYTHAFTSHMNQTRSVTYRPIHKYDTYNQYIDLLITSIIDLID